MCSKREYIQALLQTRSNARGRLDSAQSLLRVPWPLSPLSVTKWKLVDSHQLGFLSWKNDAYSFIRMLSHKPLFVEGQQMMHSYQHYGMLVDFSL